MKEPLHALKGMEDILPQDIRAWQRVERELRRVFESWNFEEIRTPVLESIELFKRSIGEETDIVTKEMFEFKDRGERHLALRPEATASVVRSVIEYRLYEGRKNFGLYYWGPMYRAERPQKGRKREFYQAGCELFGESHPYQDVILVTVLHTALRSIGLTKSKLKINHLGSQEERQAYKKKLTEHFGGPLALSAVSQERLRTNPLRILDSKDPIDSDAIESAPVIGDHLSGKSREEFELICKNLKKLGIEYEIDHKLVRGLDYYTGFVFEVTHEALGAQNAIGAGGRYDSLIQNLGGPALGASGFALGIERILLALEGEGQHFKDGKTLIYFASLSPDYFDTLHGLRKQVATLGIATEADYLQTSLKKHLAAASKLMARASVILGETEMAKNSVLLKDMISGEQKEVPFEKLTETIQKGYIHA